MSTVRTQSPLVGYNNNVRHNGRVYHIQTEDSGVRRPNIWTHLFVDGGRILASKKIDYSEHVGKAECAEIVRKLMQAQHKSMFIDLRDGIYDDADAKPTISHRVSQAPSAPSVAPSLGSSAVSLGSSAASLRPAPPTLRGGSQPPTTEPNRQIVARADPPARSGPIQPSRPSYPEALPHPSVAPRVAPIRPEPPPREPSTPRPERVSPSVAKIATPASVAPDARRAMPSRAPSLMPSRSIFGSSSKDERPLDEVILGYLADHEDDEG